MGVLAWARRRYMEIYAVPGRGGYGNGVFLWAVVSGYFRRYPVSRGRLYCVWLAFSIRNDKMTSRSSKDISVLGKTNICLCSSLLSFSRDCAKSGFAIHFEWQLQIVITLSISNGFP